MKMDLRIGLTAVAASVLTLSACGKQKTSSETFQKPAEECEADVVPNRYVMRFKDGSVKAVEASSKDEFFKNHVDAQLANVDYTEHDFYVHASPTVRSAATSADNWAAVRTGADSMWAAGHRGAGVVVAVIDSGVDINHPKLAGRIQYNTQEIPNNGVDEDANGYIDDYAGWNFSFKQPLNGDNQFHGTHVAGIIAAEHSDTSAGPQLYTQGMAPEAKIIPLAFLSGPNGAGMMSDAVLAIKYAVNKGARLINASWGGAICSRSLRDAVNGLTNANVIFVAAAGNDALDIDRYKEYPASHDFPAQITVGATGDMDLMSQFSNYGKQSVHIFAPGQNIVSTVPGNQMEKLSGTSMAAPVVTGAIALLLSAEPAATVTQVRQALYNTSFKQSNYWNACRGRMDLRQTLAELRRLMAP